MLGYTTTTPTAHHNILADAEAADTVFKSAIPITLIPAHIAEDASKAAFEVAAGEPAETMEARVSIDTSIGTTRGQTVIDVVGYNLITMEPNPRKQITVVTALK